MRGSDESAERAEQLRQAVAIPDEMRAIREIVRVSPMAYEDAAILWNNEHGRGGDVLGGPDGDHERRGE